MVSLTLTQMNKIISRMSKVQETEPACSSTVYIVENNNSKDMEVYAYSIYAGCNPFFITNLKKVE